MAIGSLDDLACRFLVSAYRYFRLPNSATGKRELEPHGGASPNFGATQEPKASEAHGPTSRQHVHVHDNHHRGGLAGQPGPAVDQPEQQHLLAGGAEERVRDEEILQPTIPHVGHLRGAGIEAAQEAAQRGLPVARQPGRRDRVEDERGSERGATGGSIRR